MRIFNIDALLDGGTTVFQVEREGNIKNVRLKSRHAGEPRPLLINEIPVSKGSPEVIELIHDIEEWWPSLPEAIKTEAKAHLLRSPKSPSKDVSPVWKERMTELHEAVLVLAIWNYASSHYLN